MEKQNTSGRSLVEHWKWAEEKGLMNANTARSLAAACKKVLGVLDGWEKLDVRAINVDDVLQRFQNKCSKDYTPSSLDAYKKRFALAVQMFSEYVDNPSSWKPTQRDRPRRKTTTQAASPASRPGTDPRASLQPPTPISTAALVEYPFPLREDRFAYLRLPVDLKLVEVKRLTAYLRTLAIDDETNEE